MSSSATKVFANVADSGVILPMRSSAALPPAMAFWVVTAISLVVVSNVGMVMTEWYLAARAWNADKGSAAPADSFFMVWQADKVAAMAMSKRFFQNMASKLTTRAGHSSGIRAGSETVRCERRTELAPSG